MIVSPHRPTWATVNLTHIQYNLKQVKSHLPDETKVFAVVKANAYGHGAVAVATAIAQGVAGFCVSNLDEGLELRQAGLVKPILVLGVVPPEAVELAVANQLTLTVTSLDWLQLVLARSHDLSGLTVHVKLDTGMSRLGLREPEETRAVMAGLVSAGAVIEGIFTHFATADEADETYFQAQLVAFKAHLAELDWVPELVHASNSATAIWQADKTFTAVRLGLALYGLNPSGTALPLPYPLKPALSLHSRLAQVKAVAGDQAVGYGTSYRTSGDEVIGTVPIGYADGYIRDFQDFRVLVDGQVCPIVGRVSMDQLTIRLPRLYPLGTMVTLIGDNGGASITVTELAQHAQTINYEVVCLISDRVPRYYD